MPQLECQRLTLTLNNYGLTLMLESWAADQILAAQMGVLPQVHYELGRLDQEIGWGYYFDGFLGYAGPAPSGGFDTANEAQAHRFTDLASYLNSAAEHGV